MKFSGSAGPRRIDTRGCHISASSAGSSTLVSPSVPDASRARIQCERSCTEE